MSIHLRYRGDFICAFRAGYPSAFYCTLNTHYRIVSYSWVISVHQQFTKFLRFRYSSGLMNTKCWNNR